MLPDNYQPHEVGEHYPQHQPGPSRRQPTGFFDSPEFLVVLVLVALTATLIPIWDDRMPGRIMALGLGIFILKAVFKK